MTSIVNFLIPRDDALHNIVDGATNCCCPGKASRTDRNGEPSAASIELNQRLLDAATSSLNCRKKIKEDGEQKDWDVVTNSIASLTNERLLKTEEIVDGANKQGSLDTVENDNLSAPNDDDNDDKTEMLFNLFAAAADDIENTKSHEGKASIVDDDSERTEIHSNRTRKQANSCQNETFVDSSLQGADWETLSVSSKSTTDISTWLNSSYKQTISGFSSDEEVATASSILSALAKEDSFFTYSDDTEDTNDSDGTVLPMELLSNSTKQLEAQPTRRKTKRRLPPHPENLRFPPRPTKHEVANKTVGISGNHSKENQPSGITQSPQGTGITVNLIPTPRTTQKRNNTTTAPAMRPPCQGMRKSATPITKDNHPSGIMRSPRDVRKTSNLIPTPRSTPKRNNPISTLEKLGMRPPCHGKRKSVTPIRDRQHSDTIMCHQKKTRRNRQYERRRVTENDNIMMLSRNETVASVQMSALKEVQHRVSQERYHRHERGVGKNDAMAQDPQVANGVAMQSPKEAISRVPMSALKQKRYHYNERCITEDDSMTQEPQEKIDVTMQSSQENISSVPMSVLKEIQNRVLQELQNRQEEAASQRIHPRTKRSEAELRQPAKISALVKVSHQKAQNERRKKEPLDSRHQKTKTTKNRVIDKHPSRSGINGSKSNDGIKPEEVNSKQKMENRRANTIKLARKLKQQAASSNDKPHVSRHSKRSVRTNENGDKGSNRGRRSSFKAQDVGSSKSSDSSDSSCSRFKQTKSNTKSAPSNVYSNDSDNRGGRRSERMKRSIKPGIIRKSSSGDSSMDSTTKSHSWEVRGCVKSDDSFDSRDFYASFSSDESTSSSSRSSKQKSIRESPSDDTSSTSSSVHSRRSDRIKVIGQKHVRTTSPSSRDTSPNGGTNSNRSLRSERMRAARQRIRGRRRTI